MLEEEQNSALDVRVVADGDSIIVRKEDGFPTEETNEGGNSKSPNNVVSLIPMVIT